MSNHGGIVLSTGRRISLCELRQYSTNEGSMEGYPTSKHNKEQVEELVREHHGKPYPVAPYLIPPVEEPVKLREGEHHPYGAPMLLPRITCIGRFFSLDPIPRRVGDYSGLVVIWFQNEFAFPLDPVVLSQMLLIDWDRYAYDWDF
jgi:hypothetical protein